MAKVKSMRVPHARLWLEEFCGEFEMTREVWLLTGTGVEDMTYLVVRYS